MDLMTLKAILTLDSSEYENGLSRVMSGAGKIAKIGAGAITAAGAATVAFGKTAVSAGMDFDAAMSQVAATMGVSVDQIENLRDFAQEMGSTTAFSATQAAEALNYMALAGYDADTSMSMLPTVLNLAAAGGMELATASDMVTDAQTALGLSLDETTVMVDQMAKASSTTNTSVAQLGDAMLTIGGNARNLAGGTAELSSVLGALADNSIKGSEAGTHLRNIMLAMTPTTDDAAAAWERLGVDAYNADGSLRPLEDTFGDISAAMEGMTDQEKTRLLSDMFNKTDLAAVNALLNTSAERWREIDTAVGNASGSAKDMADTQLDNLAGDVTIFKSALEGLQIAVSDSVTPVLRDFVTMGTEGLSEITEAFKNGGFEAAVETFGGWLSDALLYVVDFLPRVMDAGARMLTALLDGIVRNLPKVIQTAKTVLVTVVKAIIENLPKIVEAGVEAIAGLAKGIGEALPELVPMAVDAVLTIVDGLLDNIDLIVEAALALMVGLAEGIIRAIPRIIDAIPKVISSLINAVIRSAPKIAQAGFELFVALIKNLPQIIVSIVKAVPSIIGELVRAFVGGIPSMVNVGIDLIKGIGKGIMDGVGWVVDKVKSAGGFIIDVAKGIFGINSPSKVFAGIGASLDEGLAKGIVDNTDMAERAMASLTKVTEGSFTPNLYTDEASAVLSGAGMPLGSRNSADNRSLNVTLVLDREVLARAVYRLNNDETQRVGVKLAGGVS